MHQKERKKEKNEQEQETDKSNQRPTPSLPLVSHIYHRIKVETREKKRKNLSRALFSTIFHARNKQRANSVTPDRPRRNGES